MQPRYDEGLPFPVLPPPMRGRILSRALVAGHFGDVSTIPLGLITALTRPPSLPPVTTDRFSRRKMVSVSPSTVFCPCRSVAPSERTIRCSRLWKMARGERASLPSWANRTLSHGLDRLNSPRLAEYWHRSGRRTA